MKSVISKNILSFIGNTVVLAQMFIVILFFECYSIRFENQSLLNLKIGFDEIHIKPIFTFLYFLAVARMIWLILNIVKLFLHSLLKDFDIELTSKVSFTAFLLLILCLYYLFLLEENPSLFPFYNKDSTFLNRLYLAPFLITSFISFFITIFTSVNLSGSDKSS